MAGYGARTGVTTARRLIERLNRLYTKFSVTIDGWVNASSASSGDKAELLAWLHQLSDVARIVKGIPDD